MSPDELRAWCCPDGYQAVLSRERETQLNISVFCSVLRKSVVGASRALEEPGECCLVKPPPEKQVEDVPQLPARGELGRRSASSGPRLLPGTELTETDECACTAVDE